MYNHQAANTTGSMRRQFRRFAGICLPNTGKGTVVRRERSAVDKQQRSWRLKRQTNKVVFWMLLPILILSAGWLVYTILLHSDIFRMSTVSVQGNQVTDQHQILKDAGLQRGVNLLDLDVNRIESLIRKEQWIEQVWVKRRWPSTVEIIVKEYKPFALVNLERDGNRQLYYMDSKGVVFAPSAADRDLDFPVVNGAGLAEELQEKRFAESSLGAMALDFLKLTARGNQILPTQAVSEINADPEKGLIVYLVDHPFPIYMGKEKISLRFSRLLRVLAKLYREDKIEGVSEIRMDYGENKILVSRTDEG